MFRRACCCSGSSSGWGSYGRPGRWSTCIAICLIMLLCTLMGGGERECGTRELLAAGAWYEQCYWARDCTGCADNCGALDRLRSDGTRMQGLRDWTEVFCDVDPE